MGVPTWRWGVVAALVAALAALPSLARLLPADADDVGPGELLERVRTSESVGWSGYGESTGTLAVPDVRELGDLPALFGGATRTRTWWRGPRDARVDVLTAVGERDVVLDPAGAWLWDSEDDEAVRVDGEPAVRLPRGADLVAPVLGRRLARTPDLAAAPLPDQRVAGVRSAGLRLTPPPGTPTTVSSVDLWAEPRSGLVLRVQVRARGAAAPALSSQLLDVALERPAPHRTAFAPPPSAQVTALEAPDLAAAVDRFAPFDLPDALAGQPRRDRVDALRGAGGVGTYGEGLTALVVVPLPRDVARRAVRGIDPADEDGRAALSTPLLSVLVERQQGGAFLLAGTVPPELLDAALADLRAQLPVLQ